MKSFLPNDIKDENRKIIFDIFMQEPNLAKIEVSSRTAMSSVTVNKIIDYFEETGIVKTSGEVREGSGGMGRKRVIYSFNQNSYLSIGIELIGNVMYASLINLYSEEIDSVFVGENIKFMEESFAGHLAEIKARFEKKAEEIGGRIIGVGIGVDGAISQKSKTIRMRAADDEKEETFFYEAVLEHIKNELKLPVVLENDVNASTVAEFMQLERTSENVSDMLLISLGEGIGAGLVLDKKLYKGVNAGIGELEFKCFDPEFVYTPSAVGWLEQKLSLKRLKSRFGYTINQTQQMEPSDRTECINYISKYLALTIINTLSLLNVHQVVLTGLTVQDMPEEITEAVQRYIQQFAGWKYSILCGTRERSTAVGAAILALQEEMTKIITG